MLTRRGLMLGAAALSFSSSKSAASVDWRTDLDEWLSENENQGKTLGPKLLPKDDERWEQAQAVMDASPWGVTPIEVAKYFVGDVAQKWIRAWPTEYANPIIVLFFAATHDKSAGDTTPWCAAFLNWCLQRSEMEGTHHAGSQSFVDWGTTVWADQDGASLSDARQGDIAIFRHKSDPVHGHVAFFESVSTTQANSVVVLGGNHIAGKTHLIQEKTLRTNADLQLIRIATKKGLHR
ncbi:TIGR02594 family protein [Mesorhizobium sp. M2E.F.Ca.ET.209.01.1.1]|uniref:TIGR02594 family protein n=1 Tax=Mesorhizobium sp. M2E.F.Ca.ET.209.01.1.1 TaxID=2500526 RepID=UPI000FD6D104|nr:TIGR02594 family protein [Mesorhizobium sp. M2E.F.Ca.ET.209.01.1.1]TGS19039.1 TIGR02594 family protein [Mesorhizobium sp. M2E.F.Ca.ET.209.01.1.1]